MKTEKREKQSENRKENKGYGPPKEKKITKNKVESENTENI